MTDFLERDENFEPAVLPSPAELLHWGDLHSPPNPPPAPSLADESLEFTRFVPRRRKGRIVTATITTVAMVALGAWGIGSLTLGDGAAGLVAYFKGGAFIAVVASVTWGVWRWARELRVGDPRLR